MVSVPRRVCVVTGSRAEYGLLYWVIRELHEDPEVTLQLVATGMHLSPEFGLTYRAIEADGLPIARMVEMLLSSDTAVGIVKSVGIGVIGFADVFSELKPDVVVVLGDRYEILAAAQAAFFMGISIAHIHGGELTEGSIDEVIRHTITKMSRYHFVAATAYARRVIQLGESPETVFDVGAPTLDNISRLALLSREELSEALKFDLSRPFLLATLHPVTRGTAAAAGGMGAMLQALDAFPEYRVLITRPNADPGNRELTQLLDQFAQAQTERVLLATSLGNLNYLSALRHCEAVVGNSSSGIVEAPAMGKPTVNIGSRQKGRLKADSIIDCGETSEEIAAALRRALSPQFKAMAARTRSLYGTAGASTRIVSMLKRLDLTRNTAKPFHDLT